MSFEEWFWGPFNASYPHHPPRHFAVAAAVSVAGESGLNSDGKSSMILSWTPWGCRFRLGCWAEFPGKAFQLIFPFLGRKLSNTQQFPTLWEKMQENSVYSSKLPCLISGLAPGPSSQDPVSKNPADSIIQKPHSTVKVGFHRSSGWFLAIFWLWVKSRVAYTTKNCCLVAGQWCFCSSKYQWIAGFF